MGAGRHAKKERLGSGMPGALEEEETSNGQLMRGSRGDPLPGVAVLDETDVPSMTSGGDERPGLQPPHRRPASSGWCRCRAFRTGCRAVNRHRSPMPVHRCQPCRRSRRATARRANGAWLGKVLRSEALEAGRGDPNTDAYALGSVIADCISRGLLIVGRYPLAHVNFAPGRMKNMREIEPGILA